MVRRRLAEQHTFFPWERRASFLRKLRIRRAGPFAAVALVLGAALLVGMRERRDSGVRRTRATILNVRGVVDTYMADHDGGCPDDGFAALGEYRGTDETPLDAWGKPLRLECPGRARARYDLSSDGPDGEPGGLDRIE